MRFFFFLKANFENCYIYELFESTAFEHAIDLGSESLVAHHGRYEHILEQIPRIRMTFSVQPWNKKNEDTMSHLTTLIFQNGFFAYIQTKMHTLEVFCPVRYGWA